VEGKCGLHRSPHAATGGTAEGLRTAIEFAMSVTAHMILSREATTVTRFLSRRPVSPI